MEESRSGRDEAAHNHLTRLNLGQFARWNRSG
jgi:hypothetical protein